MASMHAKPGRVSVSSVAAKLTVTQHFKARLKKKASKSCVKPQGIQS